MCIWGSNHTIRFLADTEGCHGVAAHGILGGGACIFDGAYGEYRRSCGDGQILNWKTYQHKEEHFLRSENRRDSNP